MPPVEAVAQSQDVPKEPENIAKPMVGIIYPPPEVRNIVDKTASFVARNGPDFEARIRQNEISNPKFNFLNPADPYYAYYQHKVKEFSEGRGQEPVAPSKASFLRPLQQDVVKIPEIVLPKDPPPEFEFIADPPSISAFDLDVVKLTAQFVARNGRTFLTNLMNKEQRNYQFDFLRPQHSLFIYFTKLVEQYTKVLIPPKNLIERLKKEAEDPKDILKQANYRVLWAKHQEQEKRKEEEAKEKERVAYAQIDWHDFVVVETVDYQPGEVGHFPPPTSPDEVGARVLMQERLLEQEPPEVPEVRAESEAEVELDVEMELEDEHAHTEPQDMDEDSGEETEMPTSRAAQPAPPGAPQPPLPGTKEQIIVRRDYNPKQTRPPPAPAMSDQYLISPLTQEKIPAHKLQEHMKISLLDPKWREQKERQIREKSEQENVYASGENIEQHLRGIAERRTDIFGVGGEEAEIGKKIGEEEVKRPEKAVWDGHTASMEKVSQKARENISIEDQIAVIHKTKGLIEDEAKSKIGPSTSKPPPPMPLMSTPLAPPPSQPAVSMPSGVPPPPSGVPVPTFVRLPPQGVAAPVAPRPIAIPMMPTRPVIVSQIMQPRPPAPLMQTRPALLGVPMAPMTTPMPVARPMYQPVMAPNAIQLAPPVAMPHDDEPLSKKAKTEDNLIPEHQWLMQRPGPVTVRVQVPAMQDKPEWNLAGQMVTFTFSPQESIASIKSKIADTIGMPVGKQKLQYDGLFIKDSNTLAFYNFMPDSVVILSTKERGGRKK